MHWLCLEIFLNGVKKCRRTRSSNSSRRSSLTKADAGKEGRKNRFQCLYVFKRGRDEKLAEAITGFSLAEGFSKAYPPSVCSRSHTDTASKLLRHPHSHFVSETTCWSKICSFLLRFQHIICLT